jgi:hypothetical protein
MSALSIILCLGAGNFFWAFTTANSMEVAFERTFFQAIAVFICRLLMAKG